MRMRLFEPFCPSEPSEFRPCPVPHITIELRVAERRHNIRSVLRSHRRGADWAGTSPKFLKDSGGILLIRREIVQNSVSNYWQQGE